ncbi:OmpA family protein [Allopusillimonas ginsengisoli]|uniref:OmpA family protein n=1 Tax=Allopusillimonas ginsengisoli TaxID=453575 RepID=UPI0010C17083|nr:OmpA family protein [Allopusillimonas ginsengisoli]
MLKDKKRTVSLFAALMTTLAISGCATMEKPIILDSDVAFAFGSADLTPEGRNRITQLVPSLIARGETRLDIIGHTDRIGDAKANMRLSERRADSVRQQIVAGGFNPERIRARGAGESHPLVYCEQQNQRALIECLAPNRRVEINITDIRW